MNRPPFSEALVRQMYAEYQAGKSLVAVAAQFGRSGNSLHSIFKHRGLKMRPILKVDSNTTAAMYADYLHGLSLSDVGAKWGRSRRVVFSIFRHRGFQLRSWKETVGVNQSTKSAPARLGVLVKSFGGEKTIATQLRRAA